jgi:hypothetical protein
MQICIGAQQLGRSLLYMLTVTWSPCGAHGYVISGAIGVSVRAESEARYAKAAAGDFDKCSERPRPRLPFPEPRAARLKGTNCSCMIRLDIQLM